MINVEMTDLPVEKIKKIREWLDKEEFALVENCVASQIAQLQTVSTNTSLDKPQIVLAEQNPLSPDSIDTFKQAAALQIFLNVFRELRNKETEFKVAKLTI